MQQLEAIRQTLVQQSLTVAGLSARFPAAKRSEISHHLEALVVLGVVREGESGEYDALRPHLTHAA